MKVCKNCKNSYSSNSSAFLSSSISSSSVFINSPSSLPSSLSSSFSSSSPFFEEINEIKKQLNNLKKINQNLNEIKDELYKNIQEKIQNKNYIQQNKMIYFTLKYNQLQKKISKQVKLIEEKKYNYFKRLAIYEQKHQYLYFLKQEKLKLQENIQNQKSIKDCLLSIYQNDLIQNLIIARWRRVFNIFIKFQLECQFPDEDELNINLSTSRSLSTIKLTGISSILNLPLPNSGNYQDIPIDIVTSVLSHITHLINSISNILNIILPHSMLPFDTFESTIIRPHGNLSKHIPLTPAFVPLADLTIPSLETNSSTESELNNKISKNNSINSKQKSENKSNENSINDVLTVLTGVKDLEEYYLTNSESNFNLSMDQQSKSNSSSTNDFNDNIDNNSNNNINNNNNLNNQNNQNNQNSNTNTRNNTYHHLLNHEKNNNIDKEPLHYLYLPKQKQKQKNKQTKQYQQNKQQKEKSIQSPNNNLQQQLQSQSLQFMSDQLTGNQSSTQLPPPYKLSQHSNSYNNNKLENSLLESPITPIENTEFQFGLSLLRANIIVLCIKSGIDPEKLYPPEALLLNLHLLQQHSYNMILKYESNKNDINSINYDDINNNNNSNNNNNQNNNIGALLIQNPSLKFIIDPYPSNYTELPSYMPRNTSLDVEDEMYTFGEDDDYITFLGQNTNSNNSLEDKNHTYGLSISYNNSFSNNSEGSGSDKERKLYEIASPMREFEDNLSNDVQDWAFVDDEI